MKVFTHSHYHAAQLKLLCCALCTHMDSHRYLCEQWTQNKIQTEWKTRIEKRKKKLFKAQKSIRIQLISYISGFLNLDCCLLLCVRRFLYACRYRKRQLQHEFIFAIVNITKTTTQTANKRQKRRKTRDFFPVDKRTTMLMIESNVGAFATIHTNRT